MNHFTTRRLLVLPNIEFWEAAENIIIIFLNFKTMEQYRDLDGDSNILEYELGGDYIKVTFADGSIYLYTYSSAGSQNIEEMKMLAARGDGLNSFISKYVRKNYASKLAQ